MYNTITTFLKDNHEDFCDANQRLTIVFHDLKNDNELQVFVTALCYRRKLIMSSLLDGALAPEHAASKLGEEYDLVLFDARVAFNPDVLGVVSGVLCGGGCLLVLLPEENKWHNNTSLFLQRVSMRLLNQSGVYYFNQAGMNGLDVNFNRVKKVSAKLTSSHFIKPFKSEDQRDAVESIVDMLQSNREACCVLTSGRGRGKSSALGFIANELLQNSECKLLISAPKLSVADPLFFHLQRQCPQGSRKRAEFVFQQSKLKFIAPDFLLETLPEADVLLIDEAAVIPLSMLQKLLQYYPKIVFSTTTHGYEGTGRGFVLKFYKLLDKIKPAWKKIELHQPVRWSKNDPLEAWVESILFLNVKLPKKLAVPADISKCKLILIDREKLLKDSKKLSEIFSLLVFAHYRTSPSDFQYLLDSENIRIYSLEFNNNCLAVLVVNQEGGYDSSLSTAIYRGERRPKGNLLAQTLCFHAGCESAAELTYARVMRIAVHPQIQQLGFGSYLLQQVIFNERLLGIDVLGSSFSATSQLLDFWNKAGLSLVRIGFSRDHVTASNSAVMAMSLGVKGSEIIDGLSLKFKQNISLWVQGPLSEISDDIKMHNLLQPEDSVNYLVDLNDVDSFANYNRNYDACMPAIIRFINNLKTELKFLNDNEQNIIKLSMQYLNDWKSIVKCLRNSSKAKATKELRNALANLLKIKK